MIPITMYTFPQLINLFRTICVPFSFIGSSWKPIGVLVHLYYLLPFGILLGSAVVVGCVVISEIRINLKILKFCAKNVDKLTINNGDKIYA